MSPDAGKKNRKIWRRKNNTKNRGGNIQRLLGDEIGTRRAQAVRCFGMESGVQRVISEVEETLPIRRNVVEGGEHQRGPLAIWLQPGI